jgi:hypothetical protein
MRYSKMRWKMFRLGATLTAFGLGGYVAAAEAPSLLFGTPFEKTAPGASVNAIPGIRTTRNGPVVSRDVARGGVQSMKTVVNPKTSVPDPGRPGGPYFHAEAISEATDGNSEFHTDYWFGFSVYFPPSHTPAASGATGFESLAQWQTTVGCGGHHKPMGMGLLAKGGRWQVVHVSRWCGTRKSKTYDLGAWSTSTWTDWVFHVRWSASNKGLLEIWKNGKKVVDQHNIATTDQAAKAPRFKWGIYVRAPKHILTAYHDDVRIAKGPNARQEDVTPGKKLSGLQISATAQ